ncbi:MAG: GTP-binding protein, partial [Clostridia bacterium]|nr:GTP-binding protein [Clostridia bacterium]
MGSFVTVADAGKCRMYIKNFGEFFLNQIEYAGTILLSRTQNISQAKLEEEVALLRTHNAKARIITTPWDDLTGEQILSAMEEDHTLAEDMLAVVMAQPYEEDDDDDEDEHHHHHHHHGHDDHDEDDEHEHHHHHDHDDDDEDEHEHHHHDHDDDDDDEHEHHHHHEHDDDEDEHEHHHHDEHGHHHHHHHHGHDADEIFESWGVETVHQFTESGMAEILTALDGETYGVILRAKGIVPCADGGWIHFDYTPGEQNVRKGPADVTGRLCVIGSKLEEKKLADLFGVA